MSTGTQRAVMAFKQGLTDLYGSRLRGLYLFGSEARGDATAESDLDLAIVLDRFERYADEIERTGGLASRISLESGRTLSRVFLDESHWRGGQTAFLDSIRRDAVPA